jgi:outer membrane protein OmpA-like peptidoglycan-associated protein
MPTYNLELSKNRAKTIADALLQKSQIDDSRVMLNSYGEAQPTEQGNAATAHAANRRVTVAITASKKSIALK